MDNTPGKNRIKILIFKGTGIVAPTLVTHLGEGFMNLGHDVMVYDIYEKLLSGSPETRRENVYKFLDSLTRTKPDLAIMYGTSSVFIMSAPPDDENQFRFPREAWKILNGDSHLMPVLGIPYVCFFGDNPLEFNTGETDPFRFMMDVPGQLFTIWDDYYSAPIREKGFRNLMHCPLATSPSFFFDIPREQLPERFRCDVSFLGSPSPERIDLLKEISRFAEIAVFGGEDWKDHGEIAHLYRGGAAYPDDANLLYNGSKINIEIKKSQVKTTFTQRQFDASAGGNFVLGDHRPGLERYFVPEKEFVTFDDFEDLLRKIDYYLQNENERNAIAGAAKQRTLAEHTWTHRAASILERFRF